MATMYVYYYVAETPLEGGGFSKSSGQVALMKRITTSEHLQEVAQIDANLQRQQNSMVTGHGIVTFYSLLRTEEIADE